MKPQRIAIRTDANSEIGTGHFMRCLTLADALKKDGAEICFISRQLPVYLIQMLEERKYIFHALPELSSAESIEELPHSKWLKTSQAQDAKQAIEVLGPSTWDWIIVDHYALDHRFEIQMRSVAKYIMVIDDLADRAHACDILLDQNFYCDQQQRYLGKVPAHCRLLLGPGFALLRPEFKERRQHVLPRRGAVQNILVFFGGVDAGNLTGKTLEVLIRLNLGVKVDVVIGQLHPNKQEISQTCEQHNFNCHLQTTHMADLMAQADLAIGAGGIAIWERSCMGLPSVCMVTADNQRKQIADLQSAHLVLTHQTDIAPVSFLTKTLSNLTNQSKLFAEMSIRAMALVDGAGAVKVAAELKAQALQVRLAGEHDAQNIFQWRNHPSVRKYSSNPDEITWNEHLQWFEKRLNQSGGLILIGEIEKKPVGVVRFDISQNNAEVSIYLVPDSGLKGLGTFLLSQAETWLRDYHPHVAILHAKVLPNNEPSQKLFTKLNYELNVRPEVLEFVKEMRGCK